VGAGIGARTYHLRDIDTKAKTYLSGYGALGTEFQLRRIAAATGRPRLHVPLQGCDG